MNVIEAATHLGVSPRRVRALITEGRIPARRVGREWEIDDVPSLRTRRPLSHRSRDQLAKAIHSRSLQGLTGQERARVAERLHLLRTSSDPAVVLLDWWGGLADENDAYVQNLLERALAGDSLGVRDSLRRRQPAYLATTARLADRVATERAVHRFTRERLAREAGVPVAIVRQIERGSATPTPGPVRRVLRTLDVTPSALPPLGVAS
ncbi:helix-turn-helix domain-containing protein [Microbacterium sp. PMB16]|uniref:helix-turn-helix domain-containing protein n=1 Tax=Microbacterium sp. PMB16 TaxID=3120157 RepID=UPI003F4BE949